MGFRSNILCEGSTCRVVDIQRTSYRCLSGLSMTKNSGKNIGILNRSQPEIKNAVQLKLVPLWLGLRLMLGMAPYRAPEMVNIRITEPRKSGAPYRVSK